MKRMIMLCLGLATASLATAQERTVELDLQKAIDIALDENPTILVAGLEIERQRDVKRETIGSFLPTLSAEGTYTRAIEQSTMGGLPVGSDNTWQGSATISMPLLVPALFQTLKLNDQQIRAAVESARSSKITMVNEVKKAYYQVLVAEEGLAVLRTSEATIKQTVDDTRTKYENDMASEYDLVTAEVQLSNLQPSIYQAENGIATARKVLGRLLGMPDDVRIIMSEKLSGLVTVSREYTRDVTNNSDLRSMDIQKDVLHRQLGVLRTQRMPSLAAFGNVTATGQDQIDFGTYMTTGQSKTEFKWQHPINVGATLSIPIFAGFTNTKKERQLKNSIRQLELSRDYTERGLNVELSNAIASIETAERKMEATGKTITQAQKGYDISKVRYEAEMGTILELNNAELSLTNARLNYTQAVYELLTAQADYEKLIGKE